MLQLISSGKKIFSRAGDETGRYGGRQNAGDDAGRVAARMASGLKKLQRKTWNKNDCYLVYVISKERGLEDDVRKIVKPAW